MKILCNVNKILKRGKKLRKKRWWFWVTFKKKNLVNLWKFWKNSWIMKIPSENFEQNTLFT